MDVSWSDVEPSCEAAIFQLSSSVQRSPCQPEVPLALDTCSCLSIFLPVSRPHGGSRVSSLLGRVWTQRSTENSQHTSVANWLYLQAAMPSKEKKGEGERNYVVILSGQMGRRRTLFGPHGKKFFRVPSYQMIHQTKSDDSSRQILGISLFGKELGTLQRPFQGFPDMYAFLGHQEPLSFMEVT